MPSPDPETTAPGVDRAPEDVWSSIAAEWAARWGRTAEPVQRALLEAAGVGPGVRLLDVGCGPGELLRLAADRGAVVAGCDPAPGMVALARETVPGADLRVAGFEALPWPDHALDVVTAVNALHFADDADAALQEVRRVLGPGGRIAVASWAERALNELDALETAVAEADGDALPPDDGTRLTGGMESLLADAGFTGLRSGLVEAPWEAVDDDALVAGVLLGEDASVLDDMHDVLVRAAAPFRTSAGGYRLRNRLRWAVGVR